MPAPLHILGQDLYEMREARGDNHYYPPVIDFPDDCVICGAERNTCDHGVPNVPYNQLVQLINEGER